MKIDMDNSAEIVLQGSDGKKKEELYLTLPDESTRRLSFSCSYFQNTLIVSMQRRPSNPFFAEY